MSPDTANNCSPWGDGHPDQPPPHRSTDHQRNGPGGTDPYSGHVRNLDADGLDNATFSYQWLADDAYISGATGSTYTLADADEGKAIKVRVSFTDDAGNEETLTSAATDAVSAASPPPPDNVRAVAMKTGSVELRWEAPDDETVTGYRVERYRSAGGRNNGRSVGNGGTAQTLVEDTGNTDTDYTDTTAQSGTEYRYRVSAINESGVARRRSG